MNIATVALVLVLSAAASAAELPELVFPAGVGVNIHFTRGHEQDLDLIAAAGFKFIRMDFGWASTERARGEYDWSEYDELTANLDRRGMRAYYILDYSNPLYEGSVASRNPITGKEEDAGTASPQHPESLAAFARWSAAAVRHFRGRHVVWEIWNEPNIFFWKPKPDVAQYTALALAVGKAVRDADPQATLVAPASSTFPWEFLEGFLKSGVLEYLDGVSVHPYRNKTKPPETAAEDYRRLRELIARYAPNDAKRQMPILSGEWGYSSNSKGVSLETQAAFIARQQLSNLLNGVPLSIWYDWKNDGEDPDENEHNFGTVTHALKPKPAYLSIQALTRELSAYRIARRREGGNPQDFVLVLERPGGAMKLACWTLGEPHTVTLELAPTSATELAAVGSDGARRKLGVRQNRFEVELAAAPQYIALQQAALK